MMPRLRDRRHRRCGTWESDSDALLPFACYCRGGSSDGSLHRHRRAIGLTVPNTFGGKDKKESILESTEPERDFRFRRRRDERCLHRQRATVAFGTLQNDGTGHFAEIGRQAGLTRTGWAQAACVGDIDNDGHRSVRDLLWAQQPLPEFRKRQVPGHTERAGLPTGARWGSDAPSSTTTVTACSISSSPIT